VVSEHINHLFFLYQRKIIAMPSRRRDRLVPDLVVEREMHELHVRLDAMEIA
jgi:hypothetical protein